VTAGGYPQVPVVPLSETTACLLSGPAEFGPWSGGARRQAGTAPAHNAPLPARLRRAERRLEGVVFVQIW
jgi:hypothetical protein